jgi:hypothetical protein
MIFADGLVHCPVNVQCDERGRVVLLDCGLAVTLDDDVRFSFALCAETLRAAPTSFSTMRRGSHRGSIATRSSRTWPPF